MPDALAELLIELRDNQKPRLIITARSMQDWLLFRMKSRRVWIPKSLLNRCISEVFRQRIEQTGLRDTVGLLGPAVKNVEGAIWRSHQALVQWSARSITASQSL